MDTYTFISVVNNSNEPVWLVALGNYKFLQLQTIYYLHIMLILNVVCYTFTDTQNVNDIGYV